MLRIEGTVEMATFDDCFAVSILRGASLSLLPCFFAGLLDTPPEMFICP